MSVETAESADTRQPTAGISIRSKAKSRVSEVSESENNKHDDGTWTPACSPHLNTVKEVGFADEGRWMFALGQTSTEPELE